MEDNIVARKQNFYHIWITALVAAYEGKIIQGLITKGYAITAANGSTTTLISDGSPCVIIALRVEKEGITSRLLYEDIYYILCNIEAKYYSVVISEYSHQSLWSGSNIILDRVASPTVDKKLN